MLDEKSKLIKQSTKSAPTNGLDVIITFSISLVFLLCPLFFTGFVSQGIGFEKMMLFYLLVLLGVVAWVTKGVVTGELSLKRTPLDVPIIVALCSFSISTALSVSQKDSLIGSYGNTAKGLVAMIAFILFYYLIINNINTGRIKIFFCSFVASCSLVSLFSLLQVWGKFILPLEFTHLNYFNSIGTLSGLSMFLAAVFPILVVAATQLKNIFPKLNNFAAIIIKTYLIASILVTLVVLFLIKNFANWPVAIVGIVIVLMFFLAKIIKTSSNDLIIPLASFLVLIIFFVLGSFNLVNLNLPNEISLSTKSTWDVAKNSLRESPIFGSGPSTFYYSFSKFKDANFNNTPLWNVRFDTGTGSIFEMLATVGILGTLAAIVLGLISLSVTFLTLIKTTSKETNSILLGLFSTFVVMIAFSLFTAQNNTLILMIMIVAAFAVATSLEMYPERFKSLNLSFRSSAKYALALAAIFLCVSAGVVILFTMGIKMYLADFYARQSLLTGDLKEKIVKLENATALAPYQDSYYLNKANNYMNLANQVSASNGDIEEIKNYLYLAREEGEKAITISPKSAEANEALALIYENASFYTRDALEWAERLYGIVSELEPNNPVPHMRIALVNMARYNLTQDEEEQKAYIEEALRDYDKAIAKKQDMAAAHYGKAVIYEKNENLDKAIEEMKLAFVYSGNNLDYQFELGRLYFNRGISQSNLSQTASKDIAERDVNPEDTECEEGEQCPEETISVETESRTGSNPVRNDDLNAAEMAFGGIVAVSPNHANALYSLAFLYQKLNETSTDNYKFVTKSLLEVLKDQPDVLQTIKEQLSLE
ncbi:MAG: hypothetical protein ABH881_03870 [bacterium]